MKRIKCAIADDELLSLELLETYILRLDDYQVVARCRNGMEVFNSLKTDTVDLLFLDIQMPLLNGIELIRSLKRIPPLIFTTAFREYAMDGYELNAIDYLLKPVSFERFLRAMDKFETLGSGNGMARHAAPLVATVNPFIYVKSGKMSVKLFLKDILFIEGAKDFVKIKTLQGEIVTYQTIQALEQRLSDSAFLRIHRSYIIAIDRIRAYNTTHVEVGDAELPIGLSYRRSVSQALKLDSWILMQLVLNVSEMAAEWRDDTIFAYSFRLADPVHWLHSYTLAAISTLLRSSRD